ncbi:MAG TPA: FHA domain-containing protein [Polyangiaceae bacterium]|jgi:pSer/pThr/pTyr-binding forkhead associated (FHA) protein|nr:FHA domain-containing protein [Polyangiaceae bacterium]
MALTVVIRSGDNQTPASITLDAPRIVIGRGEGCEIRLPDPSVSHRHASIRQRGTDYVVIDEGSTNGTFVGPVRLSAQAPRVLRHQDLIRVGRIWLEVRVEQALPTANPQATTREIALGLVAAALAAQGEKTGAVLRIESGPEAGRELVMADVERTYVLGRAPNADLVLGDNDASRRHVELVRRGQHVCARDLGSKNGSELGGKRLDPNKDTPWQAGQKLRIGTTELSLKDPLLDALLDLEASADEPMTSDESVDPPRGVEASEPLAEAPLPEAARAAPVVTPPRRTGEAALKSGRSLRAADLVVGLLALLVLGLSLVGLAWVLRSK